MRLQARALSLAYGEVLALQDVTAEVDGRVIGVLGAAGLIYPLDQSRRDGGTRMAEARWWQGRMRATLNEVHQALAGSGGR